MQYWLAVERIENWLADHEAGAKFFGVSERKSRLCSNVEAGDRIIFYVSSGISCFADIRSVTEDGIHRVGRRNPLPHYDDLYPYFIRTAPLLTLQRDQWRPIKPLVPILDHFRGIKDWRMKLRHSFTRLSSADGTLIEREMGESAEA